MQKKTLTALIEFATVALALYAQDKDMRADFYLKVTRISMWSSEKLGRLAGAAYNKYTAEVDH